MTPRADNLLWAPNSEPQTRFLASTDFEVLYGGAAGGGKTQALVIGALGLNTWVDEHGRVRHAIEHPRYEALLLRKFETDLDEVVRLCEEYYLKLVPGAKHKKGEKKFVFPSGATIEYGGLSKAGSEERYKSRSFQYVGWDELTEHETGTAYEYLISRVRPGNGMPNDFPCYIRATTNPDGPGQVWVKGWFRIEDEGYSVASFESGRATVAGKEYIFRRQFIRARASDNPDLTDEYTARFVLMSSQKAKALRDGWWGAPNIPGAIFREQFVRIAEEGRIGRVPYVSGYPVNTFWDLGLNDKQAIWFHYRFGREDRFVNFFQDSHKPLSFYVDKIRRLGEEHGYTFGRHYLPHDASHQRQGSHDTRSVQEMLEDLGLYPTEVVPRIGSITDGIELSRQALDVVWFDRDNCKVGTDMLKLYRFKFDPKQNTTLRHPLHNEASNAADAFRQYAQGYFEPGAPYGSSGGQVGERTPLGLVAKPSRRARDEVQEHAPWIV